MFLNEIFFYKNKNTMSYKQIFYSFFGVKFIQFRFTAIDGYHLNLFLCNCFVIKTWRLSVKIKKLCVLCGSILVGLFCTKNEFNFSRLFYEF